MLFGNPMNSFHIFVHDRGVAVSLLLMFKLNNSTYGGKNEKNHYVSGVASNHGNHEPFT
ncbi:hypothetical protein L3i20_v208540 [Paenibacillus sp. L3-i20]|nr:hypothetical protein L3i20_v208540 [Paenibacillus sp. L3-i20]